MTGRDRSTEAEKGRDKQSEIDSENEIEKYVPIILSLSINL